MTEAQLVELVRRYQRHLNTVASTAGDRASATWDQLGSWDRSDIARFAAAASAATKPARATGAALAGGFVATIVALATPTLTPPADPDWSPAFFAYWASLAKGDPWVDAITSGRSRAEAIGFDSVHAAARDASQQIDTNADQIVGWERVLDGSSCAWCADVATQLYITADSASFGHDRCGCTVSPVTGDHRPGRVINSDLYSNLRATPDDAATGYVDEHGNPAPRPAAAPNEPP